MGDRLGTPGAVGFLGFLSTHPHRKMKFPVSEKKMLNMKFASSTFSLELKRADHSERNIKNKKEINTKFQDFRLSFTVGSGSGSGLGLGLRLGLWKIDADTIFLRIEAS